MDETEVRKRVGLLAQRPSTAAHVDLRQRGLWHAHSSDEEESQGVQGRPCSTTWRSPVFGTRCTQRLHDPATSLSIGQQQRLCLARGLAVEPEIILGDEPTSALDPLSSQNIEKRLLDLKKDYTTVIVTHTLRQAKRLADYVVYMYLGEVVEAGPARSKSSTIRSTSAPAPIWKVSSRIVVPAAVDSRGLQPPSQSPSAISTGL